MKSVSEMNTAILEAEGVRARHDGIHEVHSYLCVLHLCRDIKAIEHWLPAKAALIFDDTMRKIRVVNFTGFPPRFDLAV